MRRVKDASLVVCLFLVLLVIFSSCLQATPVGALIGALAGTPVLVHMFNRLAPRRENQPESLPHASTYQPTGLTVLRTDGTDRRG